MLQLKPEGVLAMSKKDQPKKLAKKPTGQWKMPATPFKMLAKNSKKQPSKFGLTGVF